MERLESDEPVCFISKVSRQNAAEARVKAMIIAAIAEVVVRLADNSEQSDDAIGRLKAVINYRSTVDACPRCSPGPSRCGA
jgi:hypothetical protein